MTRIPRELRKQRCIMTTDSQWEAITSRAGRAGMTISQFMVRRTLDGEERQPVAADPPPVLPPGTCLDFRHEFLAVLHVRLPIRDRIARAAGGTGGCGVDFFSEKPKNFTMFYLFPHH